MIDQIKIGNKSSYDDFFASLAHRKIGQPKKKIIKETVPFSNETYDFSAINGEIYWEERELEYIFEILADTPEDLENYKSDFATWVMNVFKQNIYDPFISNYHFLATYEDMDFDDDDDVEKTTATVKFAAYPYKISNEPRIFSLAVAASSNVTMDIENKSSHKVTPTITVDKPITIVITTATGEVISYSFGAGSTKDERMQLEIGGNVISIQNNNTDSQAIVSISYDEEVF